MFQCFHSVLEHHSPEFSHETKSPSDLELWDNSDSPRILIWDLRKPKSGAWPASRRCIWMVKRSTGQQPGRDPYLPGQHVPDR